MCDVDSYLFWIFLKLGNGALCAEESFTERIAVNDVIVVYQPGINGDKVGHKTGNTALEHGAISTDDVFQVDIRLVRLMHHYICIITMDLKH